MRKPNIIIILADDLGYGDLGCYGSIAHRTPHCDALAAGGIRFTDFHAAAAWCVPSRVGLMTGCHPYRSDMRPWNTTPLPVRSLAAMLREAGYSTALVGKWHLGMKEGCHPLEQGFDYYYGTPGSNDVPPPEGRIHNLELFRTCGQLDFPVQLFRMGQMIECPADQELFVQRYTAEAKRWISENKENPFFLYLAHNAPHVPVFPSDQFKRTSRGGRYGDVVQELDWSIGEVMKTLEEEGIAENTIVVFTSDNGPWSMFWEFGGSAWPLRGEKATGWEGGTRVPTIVSMPGTINPAVTDEFVVGIDFYATFARMTGGTLPEGPIDSLDVSEMLFEGKPSPRLSYLFYAYDEPFSFRSGDHKVHFQSIERMRDPVTCEDSPVTLYDPPLLFHLRRDISEKRDMAADAPEILARLTAEAKEAARKIEDKT